ncbi:PREDICTED: uncharacterized protein LOC104805671 [Tarenaya hassleriana]|uniref:uncharacterized protein LOC104805671 n=1 Tax=Tarenaya hassleriana TaxID=28532 RepID=UPI00053C430E|nr:PREDICTED: uncharacterized protein LOC104805671 [Tarenaya hassleriana]
MGEWMISSWELMESAKEELEILQTHHPNRFHYLKSELEILLRELHAPPSLPSSGDAVVLTQESSNCKSKEETRKKGKGMNKRGSQVSSFKMAQKVITKRKDRVDLALERAHLCLQKIKVVKSSLC